MPVVEVWATGAGSGRGGGSGRWGGARVAPSGSSIIGSASSSTRSSSRVSCATARPCDQRAVLPAVPARCFFAFFLRSNGIARQDASAQHDRESTARSLVTLRHAPTDLLLSERSGSRGMERCTRVRYAWRGQNAAGGRERDGGGSVRRERVLDRRQPRRPRSAWGRESAARQARAFHMDHRETMRRVPRGSAVGFCYTASAYVF